MWKARDQQRAKLYATERVCAYGYKDNAAKVDPAFGCPLKCEGKLTIAVRNYYLGEARKKLGKDMYLCLAHRQWYSQTKMEITL